MSSTSNRRRKISFPLNAALRGYPTNDRPRRGHSYSSRGLSPWGDIPGFLLFQIPDPEAGRSQFHLHSGADPIFPPLRLRASARNHSSLSA